MKVYELLNLPQFARMSLIAGESGKEREINTVNMMDAPDIIHFLNRNELLVTTAYHVKDHPYLLTELIKAMADQGCAALGIKTKRFLQEIPQNALDLANQLSFPIIELPLELSLGEIVNVTLRAILDHRAAELTAALDTHKHFTNLIMKGKGIGKLLSELSRLIQQPVQLINQHFNLINRTDMNSEFTSIMNALRMEAFTIHLCKTSYLSFSVLSTKQTYTLFPIHFSVKKIGFLAITGEVQRTNYSALLTIEQAINVISFALMKELALKGQSRSIRNDFFLNFLDEAYSSEVEIMNRAAEFSLPNNQTYIVAVGKIDHNDHFYSYSQRQQTIDDIYEFLEEDIEDSFPKIHLFTKGELCILLFEVPESANSALYTADFLREIQEKVFAYFKKTISFGVSNISSTFLNNKNSYKEAIDALHQGDILKKTAFIQSFQTKDVIELLRLIPHEELKNFLNYTLCNFYAANTEEAQSLLETLSVYLETHCQISDTAKRLFVHRNTVVYRLEKCEEILGKSLKDAETTMGLRIAFRIKALLEIGKS